MCVPRTRVDRNPLPILWDSIEVAKIRPLGPKSQVIEPSFSRFLPTQSSLVYIRDCYNSRKTRIHGLLLFAVLFSSFRGFSARRCSISARPLKSCRRPSHDLRAHHLDLWTLFRPTAECAEASSCSTRRCTVVSDRRVESYPSVVTVGKQSNRRIPAGQPSDLTVV